MLLHRFLSCLKCIFLCHLISVCAQALSPGDDWTIHHKRGKVGGIPALAMEVTQQHLYKEFCKCANTLGGNGGGGTLPSTNFLYKLNINKEKK